MSTRKPEQPAEPSRFLTANNATRLLKAGLARPRRPIDEVLERLGEPGGAEWLESAIAAVTGISGAAWTATAEGVPSLDELKAGKDRAKKALGKARTGPDVAAATAAYFVTVSAAIARHGSTISSQPPNELAGPVAELAAVAPDSWAGMLREAAERLAS